MSGDRTLLIRDFDFESKPVWFSFDRPTAVLTSMSFMDIEGADIKHDTLTTTVATLGSREEYIAWLEMVREVLTTPDMLTGHNIDRFDLPLLQAQFIREGLPLLPTLLTHDTLTALPRRRDMSASQENLINYYGLKPVCPIGMPVYKHHLSTAEWERAAMGWDDAVLTERPSSDVHGHAHLREVLIEKGYIKPPKKWSPRRGL